MKFLQIKTTDDICIFFNLKPTELHYWLYNINSHYKTFSIPKKNGETRIIDAPNNKLSLFQKKLNEEILNIYKPKKSVHAFCKKRSIKSNAQRHRKAKFLLSIDLKDFFHTITVNRVKGTFKAHPFYFNDEISSVFARLCCFNSRLPQGSPSSPILSNLVCRSLDTELSEICSQLKCQYTRYADDITISTKMKKFPVFFGDYNNHRYDLSASFSRIFSKNNLYINKDKTRFQGQDERQVVTGLTVNKKININRYYLKKVRAILHAIEKFGIRKAMEQHFLINNININKANYKQNVDYFLKRTVGKIAFIGFIKGKDNNTYIQLYNRIKKIYPQANLSIILKEISESDMPV